MRVVWLSFVRSSSEQQLPVLEVDIISINYGVLDAWSISGRDMIVSHSCPWHWAFSFFPVVKFSALNYFRHHVRELQPIPVCAFSPVLQQQNNDLSIFAAALNAVLDISLAACNTMLDNAHQRLDGLTLSHTRHLGTHRV